MNDPKLEKQVMVQTYLNFALTHYVAFKETFYV